MKYRIEHESHSRMRIRLYTGALSDAQTKVIEYAFSAISGVKAVTVYPPTSGVAIQYSGNEEARNAILERLDRFRFENVELFAKEMEENPQIDEEEVRERKLSPELKRKLRTRIVIEAAADALLPMPVQLAYHAYQFIWLKNV